MCCILFQLLSDWTTATILGIRYFKSFNYIAMLYHVWLYLFRAKVMLYLATVPFWLAWKSIIPFFSFLCYSKNMATVEVTTTTLMKAKSFTYTIFMVFVFSLDSVSHLCHLFHRDRFSVAIKAYSITGSIQRWWSMAVFEYISCGPCAAVLKKHICFCFLIWFVFLDHMIWI